MNLAARALAGVFVCAVTSAAAQTYPVKPVRILIPFPPGGPTDTQARWAAQQLNTSLGQTFIADNRPGAGGVTGTDIVTKSPPDGYTLLAGNPGPLTIAPTVRAELSYDPGRDLAPIVLIAKSASCICVHPSLPVRGLKDFVALARARPGTINFGTPGIGTVGHLSLESFASQAGVKMNHVPYKGAAQFVVDLIAGNIELAQIQFSGSAPLVNQGKLKAVGVTSRERTPLMPQVPTIAEQGLQGFESYNWNGLLAPAGTPKAVIARIHEIVSTALKSAEARDYFVKQGHEIAGLGPEEYTAFIKAETQKWAQVAQKAGIPKQ
jgi:tripartite-type tricarboxylate transporter receptor subunit TctC